MNLTTYIALNFLAIIIFAIGFYIGKYIGYREHVKKIAESRRKYISENGRDNVRLWALYFAMEYERNKEIDELREKNRRLQEINNKIK